MTAQVDISYSTVLNVTKTWDSVKRTKKYDNLAELMFCRLFELAPAAREVFGLEESDDFAHEWKTNPSFVKHARRIVDMIDCSVGYLGPDFESLSEILWDLGGRHVAYGVQPEYFMSMGSACIHALAQVLEKDAFSPQLEEDWQIMFRFMASHMAQGMEQHNALAK